MPRRFQFKIRSWMVAALVLLALLVALVVTMQGKSSSIDGAQSAVSTTVSPVMAFFNRRTDALNRFFQRMLGNQDIDREAAQLRDQVLVLTQENVQMEDLRRENERLTRLLEYTKQYPEYRYARASVIARQPGAWYTEFTLNRGTDAGFAVDMSVVNEHGLVGRIIEVGPNYAKVVCIIDSRNAVSVVVQRSRDDGILKGAVDPNQGDPLCKLLYLPYDTDLVPGDLIVTSNLGGTYPKGIVVGTVLEVGNQGASVNQYAMVKPAVNFSGIEDVLVITGENGTAETPSTEPTTTPTPQESVVP